MNGSNNNNGHINLPPVEGTLPKNFISRLKGLMNWKQAFTALKYPNYKLWFQGQIVSLFGTWLQTTAQGFLIYELTQSPAYLGYVGFATGLPSWILMLYGGVIADRISRRKLLIITQAAMMIFAFILAALTFFDLVMPWHILVLAFGTGAANAFYAPARHSFVYELVDKEDLTNAIALNSTMFNSATFVGPAAGGLIYAGFGAEICFLLNGISFLAVIYALGKMKLVPFIKQIHNNSPLHDLKEGLLYVFRHKVIRIIMVLVTATSLFGISFATLIPAWAVTVLNGDVTTNGYLQSARGLGALLGALMLASFGRFRFKGKLLTLGTLLFPVLLFGFSFSRWLPLSLLILIPMGASNMFIYNMANVIIQNHVDDKLRGRVMGIYSFTFFGLMPIGALFIGLIAEYTSEPFTLLVNSLLLALISLSVYKLFPFIRREE